MSRMGEKGIGWVGFATLAFVSVGCKSGKSAPAADEAPLAPQSASGPLQTPAVLPAGVAPPRPSLLPGERQDGRKDLITRGSSYVRAYRLHQGRWQGLTIAGASRGIAVGQLDGVPGDEVLVLGNPSTMVNLRNADWIE